MRWALLAAALAAARGECPHPHYMIGACDGKGAGAACYWENPVEGVCGTCAAKEGCGLVCEGLSPDEQDCDVAALTGVTISSAAQSWCERQKPPSELSSSGPCGDAAVRDPAPDFEEPPVLYTRRGKLEVTLRVRVARLDAGAFTVRTRQYCYEHNGVERCGPTGPTMNALPGDRVDVTIVNELDIPTNQGGKGSGTMRYPNNTNFYLHGVHGDPVGASMFDADVLPQSSKTYRVAVDDVHAPGVHWYHSHPHGAAALHVMGGLVGAFVVDPSIDQQRLLPNYIADMPTRLMVITHISMCSCFYTPRNGNSPLRPYPYYELAAQAWDNTPDDATFGPEQVGDVLLVNGQWQPVLGMVTGAWIRLELVLAVPDVFLEVEVRTKVGSGGTSACEVRLVSLDGVLLNKGMRRVWHTNLAPGSRAGYAIMCDAPGTYYLQSNPELRTFGEAGGDGLAFEQNLVTLRVTGDPPATPAPTPDIGWDAGLLVSEHAARFRRPDYLRDVSGAAADATWQIALGSVMNEEDIMAIGVGSSCVDGYQDSPPEVPTCAYTTYNYSQATRGPPQATQVAHVGSLCTVENVTLLAPPKVPYALHFGKHRFQVVSYAPLVDPVDLQTDLLHQWGGAGDIRDTWPALPGEAVLLMALHDYGGAVPVHSTVLQTEDVGVLAEVYIGAADGTHCSGPPGGELTHNVPGFPTTNASCAALVPNASLPAPTDHCGAPRDLFLPPPPTPAPTPLPLSFTGYPQTGEPRTGEPRTGIPISFIPTTGEPTTGEPTTGRPTTGSPRAVYDPRRSAAAAPPRFLGGYAALVCAFAVLLG
eukprot:TRINITY_DN18618_c0_g2_i1.p1 TRINITY_DN18618_c0_g2~~TRINITY_DN18618_c0_g2_i1.p1  ORF type:complete len:815 (+),score=226.07 TRINITY_DN18618_c0_g2_i1:99-2543(+)